MKITARNRLTDSALSKFSKQPKAHIELEPGCYGCEFSMYDGYQAAGITLTAKEMRAVAEELILLSGVQSTLEEAVDDNS